MNVVRNFYHLQGRLQGVGFRPFVYRLACEGELTGWVKNTAQGVTMEIQGQPEPVNQFETRLQTELPGPAVIRSLRKNPMDTVQTSSSDSRFRIILSENEGPPTADILPDLGVCRDCLEEVFNPNNRRYRYPFTNCTYCGPRYSILNKLPYDRENTSMKLFQMCDLCVEEYSNPLDRRFHAQSNCCSSCGPQISLVSQQSTEHTGDSALRNAAKAIQSGMILAVQGIGGFHLVCDARNDEAIERLRRAKGRETKPFAVMVRDVQQAKELCQISFLEEKALRSSGAPIVLLRINSENKVSPRVAPGLFLLGVMLPYSPLHSLLMSELDHPIVATSGNLSDEPICYQPVEAMTRLAGIADQYLIHNRPIISRIDDSVVRVIANTEVVFRAGRGYAPWVFPQITSKIASKKDEGWIGLGGHQKNTLALGYPDRIILMPHLGNLDTVEATEAYQVSLDHIKNLSQSKAPRWVSDFHPNYRSTQVGFSLDSNLTRIQHHQAHLYSCIAEHQINGEVLGVVWDGSGYGEDHSIWGGEFFLGTDKSFSRVESLRKFPLPGGGKAIREPRASALGILFEIFGSGAQIYGKDLGFTDFDQKLLLRALETKLNSPRTSSVGRLFDAVSALLQVCQKASYEGQAAMELETRVNSTFEEAGSYLVQENPVDWEPWIRGILSDRQQNIPVGTIAAKFHRTLAESIVALARRFNANQVVITGGCFQNKVLSEWAIQALTQAGYKPFWNQKIPPNDGGLSVGQIRGGWNVSIGAS